MKNFAEEVDNQYDRYRARGKQCVSWHDGHGQLLEELDEFWDEVKKRPTKRDRENALLELVQLAALARIVAEDLNLLPDPVIEEAQAVTT